ncbi:M28 family peptidase [Winogradskyella jejuensis]|uniref:Por secretion system C-terminal sorting domain-containing protein n=1 Tax=Winogradskyella jejuensis TaxID=1089305 RepID=A0A1M5PA82_9FLAO|nr:M28 family peptidase [Winogradskyella jejuensis]SHG98595.1 Por secretion system C-terminal sorting domain-containing protein [Winogradskyella jejuensis]
MKRFYITLFAVIFSTLFANAQFVQDVVNAIRQDSLERKVAELSGETSSLINGTLATITTRIQSNNDLAAEYIKDHFEALSNISINDQSFNAGAGIGRNIIATQTGTVTPNNIYLICAHYDSVAEFCADDNATGTSAVLEIARILSQYETENTIVYALWDQEENGLRGSNFYAEQASANGDNIVAVVNMDMMGYQNQTANDNNFDIDLNNTVESGAIKDDLLALQPTYAPNLNPIVVQPGTPASDHKPFWDEGYGAVLVGESWITNDQTPFYHMATDRLATLDIPYYYEMVKLVAAYTATKADIVRVLSNDKFNRNTFRVFPNPVVSELYIVSNLSETLELEFYNIEGKLVKKMNLNSDRSKLDVSSFSSGVYFVNIKSNLGDSTYKFVKQ